MNIQNILCHGHATCMNDFYDIGITKLGQIKRKTTCVKVWALTCVSKFGHQSSIKINMHTCTYMSDNCPGLPVPI